MPLLERDGLGVVDQSLGHPDLPIYRVSITFLWGHLKSLVYAPPVDSDEDLFARISVAAARVRELPGIFESVRQSLHRRCQACIAVGGRNFEQLL
ncbi:hypothetical protein AVEN_116629-1 [Araneus ventricosus]|uniref:Uncharacterized protein n=1 Tax=Araneus ventricosus TaxID=182803 RepID=A0A4Y2CZJ6_ARAVE|nr:hypothetical protein AVEN_116629-1 [Araneus ventricosus]